MNNYKDMSHSNGPTLQPWHWSRALNSSRNATSFMSQNY